MSLAYPKLNQRILEMAEGDEEFQEELTKAIYKGLVELKEKYVQGAETHDEYIIQQIRHKVKPTLEMFEITDLSEILQNGKVIIESKGFENDFECHLEQFLEKIEIAIQEVGNLLEHNLNSE